MDVIAFTPKSNVKAGKQATCARCVEDCRPEECELWRLQTACGGEKLELSRETATHSTLMEVIKCQLNDAMSTLGARCATGDISSTCLDSDLPHAECARGSSQEDSSARASCRK